jgi:hypothetical protein
LFIPCALCVSSPCVLCGEKKSTTKNTREETQRAQGAAQRFSPIKLMLKNQTVILQLTWHQSQSVACRPGILLFIQMRTRFSKFAQQFVIMTIKKYLVFIFLCCSYFVSKSQTADDVINGYISFIGGEKNWKAVKTITMAGNYNYGGISFPFISYSKAPNLYKYVVTSKGKSFTQAFDGKQGWRIDGFKNEKVKTILKDKQATAMANEADVELESPFIRYREKGHTVNLEGIDTTTAQTSYKIKLTRKNGNVETFFFDSKDFSLVKKKAISANTEMDQAPLDIEYTEYKLTGNIKIPHKISCTSNGQSILIITVERVELNLSMNNSFFKP